jgi:hypothetical protein
MWVAHTTGIMQWTTQLADYARRRRIPPILLISNAWLAQRKPDGLTPPVILLSRVEALLRAAPPSPRPRPPASRWRTHDEHKELPGGMRGLWKPQYHLEAACQLKVGRSSIVRYATGERDIPHAMLDKLEGLLLKGHGDVGKLIGKLADLRDARKAAS